MNKWETNQSPNNFKTDFIKPFMSAMPKSKQCRRTVARKNSLGRQEPREEPGWGTTDTGG